MFARRPATRERSRRVLRRIAWGGEEGGRMWRPFCYLGRRALSWDMSQPTFLSRESGWLWRAQRTGLKGGGLGGEGGQPPHFVIRQSRCCCHTTCCCLPSYGSIMIYCACPFLGAPDLFDNCKLPAGRVAGRVTVSCQTGIRTWYLRGCTLQGRLRRRDPFQRFWNSL